MKNSLRQHLPYLLILWILPALVYLKTLQPSLYFIDAGATMGAAYTLGIPTPPGYPSYMVIAHIFTKIPWGTPLFRIQLFSILSALMALTMVYVFINKLFSTGFSIYKFKGNDEIATSSSRTSRNDNATKVASLVAGLCLAFSYQFWSQTLNIQSYVFTDFLMLSTLFLVFYIKPGKRLLQLGAIAAFFVALASGGSAVMIVTTAAAFLLILIYYWDEIGVGKICKVGLICLIGVAIVYSYLPIRAHARPFFNWGNPQTLELFWNHVHSAGTTFNDPITGKVVGYNLDPVEFLKAGRKYFELLFWQFTPFVLPIIGVGIFQLYKRNRRLFWILASVPIANLVYGGLVISGNRESWFIISYVVLAIFLGLGVEWSLQRLPRFARNDKLGKWGWVLLLAVVLAPLVWWYPKLSVRSNSHAMTDYANNLYAPIEKDKDSVLFGIYDTFDAAILDRHEVRGDRKDVFPVMVNELYVLPWYREHMRILRPDLVPTEIDAMTTFGRESEYNEMMNFYIEWLLKKGHPVYVSRTVFTKSVLIGTNGGVFSPDPARLKAIPAGLVERIILVEQPKSGSQEEIAASPAAPRNDNNTDRNDTSADAEMKLTDFNFTFLNPQEYEKPVYFLEGGYKSSWNDLMSEYALSYIAAAEKLFEVKAPVGQNQLSGLSGIPGIAASQTPRNDSSTTDREKAKVLLGKAERIAPNNLEVMNRLAIVYAGQGEFKKTLEYFKKASATQPDNLDLKFNLAKSYLDTGDIENGKSTLQVVLRQAQDGSAVAKAAASELSNLSMTQQPPTSWQTFTNDKMNLKFFYPEGFAVTFSSESLIKLTNNGVKKDELTFLIYSKQLQPGEGIESISSSLPFVMDGVLLQSQPAGLPGYQSIMRMYGTGPDNIVLLLLKRDQQGFGVRIFPGDSNKGQEFQGILQSIKTLR